MRQEKSYLEWWCYLNDDSSNHGLEGALIMSVSLTGVRESIVQERSKGEGCLRSSLLLD